MGAFAALLLVAPCSVPLAQLADWEARLEETWAGMLRDDPKGCGSDFFAECVENARSAFALARRKLAAP